MAWVGRGAGEGEREIRGSLHCARDGGAVPRFGRDDVPFIPASVEMT